ncbi:restriction endonuclease [Thauera sinica]|uniref:Restriction endonuclease n=1 Tax=Thauera sinica TaxID=2665146 RepID=A0ABW1AWR6_9RHOO|nr:restriction endonuclease [Thauera sp. K11]ATE61956.1 hypothetical protein CCZ27_20060 [Thauera sp. K11]
MTLSPSQFENLTLDLMQLLGLKNCVWRTPGRDGGRDIQGEFFGADFSGFTRKESWYVECKRYSDAVSWPTVWEKIAYADSNSADILLIVTSSTLSPQAIDEVNRWNADRRSLTIRFWNGQDLLNRLSLFPQILVKYCLSENPLTDSAVSILPLTKVLTKYANTGSAHSTFGKDRGRIDEVIQALAELISARIEEVETNGKIMELPFVASKDGYPWLDSNNSVESTRIDRYVMRALLALVRCHSTNERIQATADGRVLNVLCSLPSAASFHDDLRTVAFWGCVTIRLLENAKGIEIINEHI